MTVPLHSAAGAGSGHISLAPLADILRCAGCGGRIAEIEEDALVCSGCDRRYLVSGGIPKLFLPSDRDGARPDVTEMVKAFYEETPFPNYDDLDSRESLQQKARIGVFGRLLDEQLPPHVIVLEVGCGTGQLTNFLALDWRRRVIGADLCMNSLTLAKDFRDRFGIVNADFIQMNLFRPPFADDSMDVVISNGVLHHTSDPEGGLGAITAKLKPGGYMIVGLYNWLGRRPTLWRRRLIEIFGERMAALDRRLRRGRLNAARHTAWFRDQYMHPHESNHSFDEVLGWFDRKRIEFVASIPSIGDVDFKEDEPIFQKHSAGSRLDRLSTELEMLLSGGPDGGLFIMIGRKLK